MKSLRTATVWAIVIALLTALAACDFAEKPVNNSSTAEKIIYTDHHMHIMSKPTAEVFIEANGSDKLSGNQIEEFSAERILSLLNEGMLDRAFVVSGAYILGMDGIEGPDEYNDVKKENNYLAIQCAKYPEGLIGFFSVNPLKEYAIEEVDRCYDELKLPGLKLHFANSNVDLNNPEHLAKIQELFSHTAKRGIPILLHFRNDSPEFGKKDAEILINEVIAKTPGIKLQIAH
jgi:predicted TIM-barrel fold metal-dependent hydrolase